MSRKYKFPQPQYMKGGAQCSNNISVNTSCQQDVNINQYKAPCQSLPLDPNFKQLGGSYSFIINPNTGRKVSIFGKIGQKVLKNYLNNFQLGGSDLYKQRGGLRLCITGGPNRISILKKNNKKIILIGEEHWRRAPTKVKEQIDRKIIEKSVSENCLHIVNLLKDTITKNKNKHYDLFLEVSPLKYADRLDEKKNNLIEKSRDYGSSGLFRASQLNLSNLRVHWADLRHTDIYEQTIKNLNGICKKNVLWKFSQMVSKGESGGFLAPFFFMDFKLRMLKSLEARISEKEKEVIKERTKQTSEKIKKKKERELRRDKAKLKRDEAALHKRYSSLIQKNILDLSLIKEFTQGLTDDDLCLRNDLGEIIEKLFYSFEKIKKQWESEETHADTKRFNNDLNLLDIKKIFLNSTWENYLKKSLIELPEYSNIVEKILSDDVQAEDFNELLEYIKLVNIIVNAVILDLYIIGRMMKPYISDNLIIYTGAAHTRSYYKILQQFFGYKDIYTIDNSTVGDRSSPASQSGSHLLNIDLWKWRKNV